MTYSRLTHTGRLFAGLLALAALSHGATDVQQVPSAVYPGHYVPQDARTPLGHLLKDPPPAPFTLAPLSVAERNRSGKRGPARIGVQRAVGPEFLRQATAGTLPAGERIWRATLKSDGAVAIRVHFTGFSAGAGQVWLYASPASTSKQRDMPVGPYSGKGPGGTGAFWSGIIPADTVVVEYDMPGGSPDASAPPFRIDAIAHNWAEIPASPRPSAAAKMTLEDDTTPASCEIDVSCYSSYSTLSTGVEAYLFMGDDGSAYACTGSMINDKSQDFTPYFLTANHCVSTSAEAQSAIVVFQYQTPSCGGAPPDVTTLPKVEGASYLAGADLTQGDFSLLQLNGNPPGGTEFLGWATSDPSIGDSVVGIHHPQVSWTRIAFGSRGDDVDLSLGDTTLPANLFYQVDYTQGITEPGSSGSPLLNSNGQIVGTLTAADAGSGSVSVCNLNPFLAAYARFKDAYPSISQYLNGTQPPPPPAQTQSNVVATITPNPVPEGKPDADGPEWYFTITLQETAGVSTTLTGLKFSGTDYSSSIAKWFGTSTIPASGSVTASLKASIKNPPGTDTLELDGMDPGGGYTWTATQSITFLAGPPPAQPGPVFTRAGILNGATFQQTAAPGMILSVFGQNLASGTQAASSVPLPTQLAGTTATVNGVVAPLYYVSPTQVNLQIPYEVAPGAATLTITANGQSASQQFTVSKLALGIFTNATKHLVPTPSASRSKWIMLFLTGQGAVTPSIATGAAPLSSSPLADLPAPMAPVSITVGGVQAQIGFAGIPYGLVGVTQINFRVPDQARSGDQPVVVQVGGVSSPVAYLTVN